jgi:high-affinity iron transporter
MMRMRRRSHRLTFGWLFALIILLASRPGRAEEEEPLEAERLEHTLSYLSADYAMAASSSASDDEGENEEHAKIADEVLRMASRLVPPAEVVQRVVAVSLLVKRTAPQSDVTAAADDLREVLVSTYRIPIAPKAPPNAAHGRALFDQYCAACHGTTGRADTERAAALNPHPANCLDPMVGETRSPYRITTTVRFGIDGTPMVPLGFLSEADRWDLGFYVIGLRHVAPLADEGPTFDVAELARLSDGELRSDLRSAGVSETLVEPTLAELRRRAPFEDWARKDSLAILRAELERARVGIGRGEREAALLAARKAKRKGFLPAEAALAHADATLARKARSALASLTAQIESGAPVADVNASIATALVSTLRAERALWRAYGRRTSLAKAIQSAGLLAGQCAAALALIVALMVALSIEGDTFARKNVSRGWSLALPLGVATPLLFPALAVPSVVHGALDAVLSLLAVALLLHLGSRARRGLKGADAAAGLFLLTFAVTYRDALAGASLFPSIVACTGHAGPVVAGVAIGMVLLLLLLLAFACTRATRLVPARAAGRISRGVLGGLAALFLCQGLAAVYYGVTSG